MDGLARNRVKADLIAELGKLPKTVHLLNYLNDASYRRTIGGQLNLHEQRHCLARAVFFGNKGEVRMRYRKGQEDQLSALGLALETPAAEGVEARVEDVERLSPLRREHVNLLQGGLLPLRRPGILEND